MSPNPVCAIIVTYYPDHKVLTALLERIAPQVAGIIIVNNSADVDLTDLLLIAKIKVITPDKNVGVGAAHNQGILWAQQQGFDYVLLFDQDSLPPEEMVTKLLLAEQTLSNSGHKVAAVGPQYVDVRTGVSTPFAQFGAYRIRKCHCAKNKDPKSCPADFLIISGSLIKINTFRVIGEFNTDFFLDNIDLEWGLRAKNKGWQCFGICSVILQHRIGERVIRFLGATIYIHNPLRQYYIFRSRVMLYKRSYVPITWKLKDTLHVMVKLVFYCTVTAPRWQYFRMIMRGLWDGIRGSNAST